MFFQKNSHFHIDSKYMEVNMLNKMVYFNGIINSMFYKEFSTIDPTTQGQPCVVESKKV